MTTQIKPKLPKGTRDSHPEQTLNRDRAIDTIKNIFIRHGAVGIDTPVFELKNTLTSKYGEDSKLIYDLADQGGESLSLRYDLTVPFARYCATYGIENIKRYHIAKVYRRDNPAIGRGRFREFYQCAFDIAGKYGSMMADADCIKVLTEILDEFQFTYHIKLNHRKLLDAILEISGVPSVKIRTVGSSIDKLDKESWQNVKEELVSQKEISVEVVDRIGSYITYRGDPVKILSDLQKINELSDNEDAKTAFEDLKKLIDYLIAMKALGHIVLDLSLARGLDYYTGVIYEAVMVNADSSVGSIAAGGRYDNLIGSFGTRQIPSVGVSIGLERILTIIENSHQPSRSQTQVLVASVGNMTNQRLQLISELWAADIKAEFMYTDQPKVSKQIDYAVKNHIPFVLWIGEDEIQNNIVRVKDMNLFSQEDVSRNEVIQYLSTRLT